MKNSVMAKAKNIIKLPEFSKYNILLLVYASLILFIRLFHITELNGLYLFDDELEYWSHAANLLGMEWLGPESAYYSYGYSFLLVPILLLTKNMAVAYKLAIFENAIMGVLSFFVGIRIIEKIDSECNGFIKLSISFCAANYSAFLYQSNIAWSETLLYFIFLVTVWSAINFFENQRLKNTILFSLSIGALYVVHNRMLTVIIAFAITLLVMLIKRRISIRNLGIMLGIVIIICFCNGIMKKYMLHLIWGDISTSWSDNSVSDYSDSVNYLVSLGGIGTLLKSLVGKIWYLLISTIMFAYFGFIYIVKKIVSAFQNKDITHFYFFSFILLCILGMIALDTTAAFRTNFDYGELFRLDRLFYGRYEDVVSGILIMCGLLYFRENESVVMRDIGVGIAVFVVCSAGLYSQIKEIPDYFLNANNVPGVYFLKNFRFMYCCAVVSFIAIEVYSVLTLIQKRRTVIMAIASTLLVAAYIYVGENAYEEANKPSHVLYSLVDELKNYQELDIFYLEEDSILWKYTKMDNLPFLLRDESIKLWNRTQLNTVMQIDAGIFVTSSDNVDVNMLLLDNYKELYQEGDNIALIKTEESDSATLEIRRNSYNTDFDTEEDYWISNGEEGYLCYNSGMTVPYGDYTISIELTYISGDQDDLGYIALLDGENVVTMQGIQKADFINHKNIIQIEVPLPEGSENLHYFVYVKEGSVISCAPGILSRNKYFEVEKYSKLYYKLLLNGFEIESQDRAIAILAKAEEKEEETIIPSISLYGTDFEFSNDMVLQSSGEEGFLCRGPDIEVSDGQYNITFELEEVDLVKEDVGYIELKDGENVLVLRGIQKEDFVDGKCQISLDVLLQEGSESLQYLVYIKQGNIVRFVPGGITRKAL